MATPPHALRFAHPSTQRWFEQAFPCATEAQALAWPSIASGASTLLLAPTGSGKTLSAFLVALDKLMFGTPAQQPGTRVLYLSPLKALGVDVERNLAVPLAGITQQALADGVPHRVPSVGVRSGDTPQKVRAQLGKRPPDILITTPESLYLLLTSQARAGLAHVETVIVDEIHAVVGTKRGAHLALSLERLEALRRAANPEAPPLQRIGLSATQRPLTEVAAFLGGFEVTLDPATPQVPQLTPRPVTVVDAGRGKTFALRVELPPEVEAEPGTEPAGSRPAAPSIWPSLHARLLALIQEHHTTLVFVNSRRLAERLAQALNDLAGTEVARAHHGSISKEARAELEGRLKLGTLPAVVATSSLELGIDMGAVDLVVQIEAPPSVASGIQRIGRAGHQVGAVSKGVLFPTHRSDLLACAALVQHVHAGHVEETRYLVNPLDVLAQQVVAMLAAEPVDVSTLYAWVRGAAPFAELPRRAFEGVLDMLSGRYPSDRFAELRPRIRWDRVTGRLEARRGARLLAVVNGGTIPDRGLYGVYLAGAEKPTRLGELDEEMVFESQPGDVFQLGATSWRVDEITHDRVLVVPAPGEAGRMPFWKGERPSRPLEFGRVIGELAGQLSAQPAADAERVLQEQHSLDAFAASELVRYIAEQRAATGAVPSDRAIVLERFADALGDRCVAILSPFGGRVHAPWATAIKRRLESAYGTTLDVMWHDEGMLFRLPELAQAPDPALFFPESDGLEDSVSRALADTALFAAHFRENAGRALLLPKRRPGQRVPLWLNRRRSADLLSVAGDFGDFPMVLETYRECLRDVFDLPGLGSLLQQIERREVSVTVVDSARPSPFAASLLFSWVGNYLYDDDAPVAERRARALTLDHAQLRELLGEPDLRQLLDPLAIAQVERSLQHLDARQAHTADGVHDLLRDLGALTGPALAERYEGEAPLAELLAQLAEHWRVISVDIHGVPHVIAAEDLSRYRDALGVTPPPGVPPVFLEPVPDPLGDLVGRFARTHGPFRAADAASRLGLTLAATQLALRQLVADGRVVEGAFLPTGEGHEHCDEQVLKRLRRASLARHAREVEPVPADTLGRFLPAWQGVGERGRGPEALLDVIAQLEGYPLPATDLERSVLPARLADFDVRDLDALLASGEVLFQGRGSLGLRDARVALFLADSVDTLLVPPAPLPISVEEHEPSLIRQVQHALTGHGAMFFHELLAETRAFPADLLAAIWELMHQGVVTNDTLLPLRSLARPDGREASRGRGRPVSGRLVGGRTAGRPARGRQTPPGGEGRWSLLFPPHLESDTQATDTERAEARVTRLLLRHGVLLRESLTAEEVPGGFGGIYPVLDAMETAGRVRRGYFVKDLGGVQFAWPGAAERLRTLRERAASAGPEVLELAAMDPAQPYGAVLPWPAGGGRFARSAGARVWLVDGALAGYRAASGKNLVTHLPAADPERGRLAAALVSALAQSPSAAHLEAVDGGHPQESALAPWLDAAGYRASGRGVFRRGTTSAP
ncbi:MAG: DEAD/DEAH box helicase [Sandaracinaceae bacterium]|nr:DEAD/DEAH box helicase [Sandaracinaceae bacterium]